MFGTRCVLGGCVDDVMVVDLDALSTLDEYDVLASYLEMISASRLPTWFVLTLYSPNLRRVRRCSARDFFSAMTGAGIACSLFWLAHIS